MSPKESDMLISELKSYCESRGFGGRTEVARELGVSRQQLTNWLIGFRKPGVEWYFKIRKYLDEKTGE